jgi:hypothetical protein
MDTIAPFASRRGVLVTVRENLRERLITTAFVSEGPKDIWTRSWEDLDYALPGRPTLEALVASFADRPSVRSKRTE